MKVQAFFLSVLLSLPSLAQETGYRHAISGEISRLGTSYFTGAFVQYDFMFKHSTSGFFDVKAGVGAHGFTATLNGFSARSSFTYNLGSKHRFLEAGISGTYVNEYYEGHTPTLKFGTYVGPTIGYRSLSAKGFQLRIYFTEYLGTNSFFTAGIGLGKAFRKRKP